MWTKEVRDGRERHNIGNQRPSDPRGPMNVSIDADI